MKDELLTLKIKSLNLNIIRALSARYKRLNLDVTPVQGRIIMLIFESDHEVCQREVEHSISCKKSTLSGILSTMEKNGLIIRKGSLDDSRRNVLVLTDKALEVANKLKEDMIELNKLIGENITQDEYTIFSEVLDKVNKNLERI